MKAAAKKKREREKESRRAVSGSNTTCSPIIAQSDTSECGANSANSLSVRDLRRSQEMCGLSGIELTFLLV